MATFKMSRKGTQMHYNCNSRILLKFSCIFKVLDYLPILLPIEFFFVFSVNVPLASILTMKFYMPNLGESSYLYFVWLEKSYTARVKYWNKSWQFVKIKLNRTPRYHTNYRKYRTSTHFSPGMIHTYHLGESLFF